MTVQEFSYEFDLYYNNIRSASAPGLDEYEKSVFLTEAQEELVRVLVSPPPNQSDFEDIEINRRYLDNLIKQEVSLNQFFNNQNITESSVFFEIPSDVFVITQEQLLILTDDPCWNNKKINVVPIRQDEFNKQKNNPFKKPKLDGLTVQAWRMDYSSLEGVRNIEIIYPENSNPQQYIFRYIQKPKPIILEDLSELDLSIDGYTEPMTSELDSITHRPIMINAAQRAKSVYDPKVNN